jgi:hypothetical protein
MRLLYKYVPLQTESHLDRIRRLVQGWIYFSSPTGFNDPFELSPIVSPPSTKTVSGVLERIRATESVISRNDQRRVVENVQSHIRQKMPLAVGRDWVASLGVLCLTTEPKDLLMWAHYASSHTGICLGFDASYAPFSEAKQVRYLSDRPNIAALDSDDLDEKVAETVLLRKSPHWKYEQEWRAVKRPISDDEKKFYRAEIASGTISSDDVANLLASEGGPGHYQFEQSALRRVVFGARISGELKTEVQSLLVGIPSVKMLQAELDRKYFVLNLLPNTNA